MKFKEFGRADTFSGKLLKEELLIIQDNKCLICKKEFSSSFNTHTDHNHFTNDIRGILCNKCNLLLGTCNDDINILKNAIKYIEDNPLKHILDDLEKKINLLKEQKEKELNNNHSLRFKKYWSENRKKEQSERLTEWWKNNSNRDKQTNGMKHSAKGRKKIKTLADNQNK